MNRNKLLGAACALTMGSSVANAASDDHPTAPEMLARYQRAAEIQTAKTHHWILNQSVTPHWISGRDQFWYERETADGHQFVIMDAASGSKSAAFDQARLAAELGKKIGRTIDSRDLPIKGVRIDPDVGSVSFSAFDKNWLFDSKKGLSEEPESRLHFTISPDGRLGVFSKDHNLWVKNFASGKETRLTTDGEEHYEYGVFPEANLRPVIAPQVIWSPDSKRIFTAQTDDRQVLDLPVIDFAPKDELRPKIVHYRAALPGDVNVPTFRLTIVEVADGRQTAVRYPVIPAVRMNDSPMSGNRMWWSGDGKSAYFVDIERGEKAVHVEAVDVASGDTRELFSEKSDTYIEVAADVYGPAAIQALPKSNQLIWYSERSGWAQLYLYDLNTGKLIRPLTHGDWVVRDLLGVDEAHRQMLISLAGREKGRNLYYQEIASVNLDTGAMKIVSSSDDDHQVLVAGGLKTAGELINGGDPVGLQGVSPSGNYFVETVTTAEKPSHTLLRTRDGRLIATVEDADASRAPAFWHWPKMVQLTAADGKTEIGGVVFRPSDYDSHRKYPVIDFIYGGPQTAYAPTSFSDFTFQDAASLAELGFVTVIIDGRGTNERSRAFHIESFKKAETASNVEDHIAGIRQLAAADPSIDETRVGITGFSGGGYMTASAMFRFPDFYSVGVAGSGNHDQRLFWATWGERYEGYPVGDYFKQQANVTYAKNLKGKLLMVHGLMDTGVHPSNVFQLEQALIDANKDFDLLVWPRARHELPSYGKRRQWDYFVENLAHEIPPHEFLLKTDHDFEREKEEASGKKPDGPKDGNQAKTDGMKK